MSEQGKANLQALGAAFFGFVAVIALGGGAMLLHTRESKAPRKAVPAAEPIDLASAAPPEAPSAILPFIRERRLESPAPLLGSDDEDEITDAPAAAHPVYARARPAAPETASNAKRDARRLQPAKRLALPSRRSPAAAVVGKETPAAREGAKIVAARNTMAKLAPAAAQRPSIAVHYGVTSRDELMGRAAGPISNIKAASNMRLPLLEWRITGDASLSAVQRAEIEKELGDLRKGVADAGVPR